MSYRIKNRIRSLNERLTHVKRQLSQITPDHRSYHYRKAERLALEWALKVIENTDHETQVRCFNETTEHLAQVGRAQHEIDVEDVARGSTSTEDEYRSALPSEHPNHVCGMTCDGQSGDPKSRCARLRQKLFGKNKGDG